MARLFEIKDDTQGPWTMDFGRLMLTEGIELQRLAGFGPRQWIDALAEDDPRAVRFAFYLARKRAGEDVQYADIDVNLFEMSITEIPDPDAAVAPDAGVSDELAAVVPTGLPTEPTPEALT